MAIKVIKSTKNYINITPKNFKNSTKISSREAKILELRQQNYSLQEIGHIYGVTRERVRQIEARAWRKLLE